MRSKIIANGRYIVYEDGTVWSVSKRRAMIPQSNGTGYLKLLLRYEDSVVNKYVHRLVAEAFIPNPCGYPEVNHIDGDKSNNCAANLEWCDSKWNKQHAARNGLTATGERNAAHKLTEDDVRTIRAVYVPNSSEYNTWTLAEMFGVSQTTIRFIVNGKYWRNVE